MNVFKKSYSAISNIIIAFVTISLGITCYFSTDFINKTVSAQSNVYYNGKKDSNYVSLMFNVYWGNEYIDGILDTLDKHNVKVTFFIGGSWADDNVDILKKIYDKGHEIGSHGYFHKDQGKLNYEQNLKEIKSNNVLIHGLLGIDMTLFAPPSGSLNDNTIMAAKDENMKVIMWSKDTIDWRDQSSSLIYSRATKNVEGGDLILMHPTKATLDALDSILNYYKDNNFLEVQVSRNITNYI